MLRQSPIIIAGAMLVSISAAHAGSPGAVSVVPPLPPGYNPTTASAGLNALYAVPPEPDAAAAPRAHAAWTRAMHSVGRRAKATITPTNRRHTPIANKRAVAESNGIIAVQSANWSGTSIVGYCNVCRTGGASGERRVRRAKMGLDLARHRRQRQFRCPAGRCQRRCVLRD
jgi:hypothetical protein